MPKNITNFFAKLLFIFFSLYVIIFFSAPFVIKTLIDKKLGEHNATLTTRSVLVDLWSARVRVEGFSLAHLGKPLATFETLELNCSYKSVAKGAFIANALFVDGLKLYVHRDQNKTFNFQKIFPQKSEEKKSASPLYFSINNINLKNANVEYKDDILKQTFTLSKADISLPFVSTIPHDTEIFTRPSAKGFFNGSPFAFNAKSRPFAKDLKSELELTIKDVDLSAVNSFLPTSGAIERVGGKLAVALKLSFEKAAQNKTLLTADVNLTEFALRARDASISLKTASIRKIAFSQKPSIHKERNSQTLLIADVDLGGVIFANKNATVSLNSASADKLLYAPESTSVSLDDLTLKKLSVKDANQKEPLLFDKAIISNLKAAIKDKELNIKSVTISNSTANIQKSSAGLNITSLAPASKPENKKENGQKAWNASVKEIAIDGKAEYGDDMFLGKKAHKIEVPAFSLNAKDFILNADTPTQIKLDANTSGGAISYAGSVWQKQKKANGVFEIKRIDLTIIDKLGFLPSKLRIFSGDLDVGGGFESSFGEKIGATLTDGFVDARRFGLYTEKRNSRLITFDTLSLKGASASYPSSNIQIGGAALSGFYANLKIDENKTLNLVKLFSGAKNSETNSSSVKTEPKAAPSLRVDKLTIQGGAIDFEDRGVKNRFKTSLSDITGSVGRLSFDKNESAKIELRANSGGYGRMAIEGEVTPSKENFALRLKAETIDVPMEQFTPYSQKFIGHNIESGSLGLSLSYKVLGRKIEASNKISLFGFSLGEETESATAVRLPYKLAIAILKDANGNIEIELPVEGSLDNPEIKSGAIVWRLIKQLIIKIVKSPFSALASLFDSSDELSYAAFGLGSATLSDLETLKLKKTADIINKKESLRVELQGFVDAQNDIKGYKEREFEKRVLSAKAKELKTQKETKIEPNEYEKYLKLAYKNESFPKPKNMLGFDKTLTADDMKTLIIAHINAGAKEMEALAADRVASVKEALIKYGVAANRISTPHKALEAPKQKEKAPDSRVDIGLAIAKE